MKTAMTPARRQAMFNGLAVALLLLASGFGNQWVLIGSALALLAVGAVLVPGQRGRGLLTVLVALGAAVGVSLLIRALR